MPLVGDFQGISAEARKFLEYIARRLARRRLKGVSRRDGINRLQGASGCGDAKRLTQHALFSSLLLRFYIILLHLIYVSIYRSLDKSR